MLQYMLLYFLDPQIWILNPIWLLDQLSVSVSPRKNTYPESGSKYLPLGKNFQQILEFSRWIIFWVQALSIFDMLMGLASFLDEIVKNLVFDVLNQ